MTRILLVEDDADVQVVVSEFVGTMGYDVVSAASAEEARCALAMNPVDLAVIDCLMSGEQGSSLAEHCQKLGIPTILTSGDPHYLELLGNQTQPFLPKPFRLGELSELISRVLRAPPKRRSIRL
jgi:two-component system, OmpR family, response regulator